MTVHFAAHQCQLQFRLAEETHSRIARDCNLKAAFSRTQELIHFMYWHNRPYSFKAIGDVKVQTRTTKHAIFNEQTHGITW